MPESFSFLRLFLNSKSQIDLPRRFCASLKIDAEDRDLPRIRPDFQAARVLYFPVDYHLPDLFRIEKAGLSLDIINIENAAAFLVISGIKEGTADERLLGLRTGRDFVNGRLEALKRNIREFSGLEEPSGNPA